MAETIITNPIAWLHVRLNGGWRRVLHITVAAAFIILVVHVLVYRGLDDNSMTLGSFCTGAFRVVAMIQVGIFLIGGPNAIKTAIQRDFTSDMISSHRQTAMRGESVVLGYMIGPTVHVTALTLLCWLTCTILASMTEGVVPASAPSMLLVCLVTSALMYWTLGVLAALATRGTTNVVGLVIVVGILSFTGILDIAPGLNLLMGMHVRGMAFGSGGGNVLFANVAVTMLSQLVFAGIIFAAAARKYARDDVPAFSPMLAFILLALCSLLGAVGLERFGNSASSSSGSITPGGFAPATQLLATLVLLLLAAFLPAAAAARVSAMYGYLKSRDPSPAMRKPRSLVETSLAATLLALGVFAAITLTGKGPLALAQGQLQGIKTLGLVALSFLFSLLTISGLLRFIFVYTQKISWILLGYVLVFWVIPPLGDLGLSITMQAGARGMVAHTWLLTCSPIGAWASLLVPSVQAPLAGGLIFQGIVAVAALFLATRARH